jgi:hypothetical protein
MLLFDLLELRSKFIDQLHGKLSGAVFSLDFGITVFDSKYSIWRS